MPAAILGGTCTLIGTSTNLVVAGFQQQRYKDDPRLSRMGIFDIAPYGLVYAAWWGQRPCSGKLCAWPPRCH